MSTPKRLSALIAGPKMYEAAVLAGRNAARAFSLGGGTTIPLSFSKSSEAPIAMCVRVLKEASKRPLSEQAAFESPATTLALPVQQITMSCCP